MKVSVLSLWSLLLFVVYGCSDNNDVMVYQKFKDQTWSRFDLLHFNIPVKAAEKNYDVFLFIHHTAEYEFDNLDFNMIMTTPSGEERIKEYHMDIRRKDGGFIGQCSKDSCEVSVALKKGLKLTKGILNLEIENLVPRMQIKGLLGLGIRLQPVR
jgi:gliding motility-associated lipoprotein GldH